MHLTDPRRKLGQVYIKVWGMRGSRWTEHTTRNLDAVAFVAFLREMAQRLQTFADHVERSSGGVEPDAEGR